jgi:uncharacterized protein
MEIAKFNLRQKEQLRDIGVDIVYVFGSQIDKTANDFSDVDFGIVLKTPKILERDFLKIYGDIFEILSEILPKEYLRRRLEMHAHEFDLVFLQQANPRMKFQAAENGRVIYKSSLKSVADFHEKAILEYFDFKYFEKIYNDAFMMRV